MKRIATNLTISLFLFSLTNNVLYASESSEDIKAFEQMFGKGPQEEDVYRTDKLLVSATGSLRPVHLAPSVATVITKEEIEEIGATTLDEILETVPGLHMIPSGLNVFSSTWSIRGLHTSLNPQVLLLLNGIPLTSPNDGSRPQTYRMPVSMISRVEVVRGPGSAVHGADAYSGVINVITKDNFEIDGTQVGARYGSFNTYDTWIQHGNKYMGWDVFGSIEFLKTDGDNDRIVQKDSLHTLFGGAFSTFSNAPEHLDTKYDFTESHLGLRKDNFTLRFYGSWHDNNGAGPGVAQAITNDNDIDGGEFIADAEYRDRNFAPNWDVGLRAHYVYLKTDNYFHIYPDAFADFMINVLYPGLYGDNRQYVGEPILIEQSSGLEATAFFSGFPGHNFRISTGVKFIDTDTDQFKTFGTDVDDQGGPLVDIGETDSVFMESQNRRLFFASIQDEWDVAPRWGITAGVRFDEYSDFGSTINPRLAVVWETQPELITKLLYGRAFRAPSFGEQSMQNNVTIVGNPDLEPETIDTYELAFDYQPTNNFHAALNLFFYQAEEIIEYVDPMPSPATNYGEQDGYGFEVEMNWRLTDKFKLSSNFAYQHSENKKEDSEVPGTPELQFYLNPHWYFTNNWSLNGQYYWIADRNRDENDTRDEIDDYSLVNLTLRRKNIVNNLDIAVAVRNLFDESAEEPSPYDSSVSTGALIPGDYPLESRAFWAEISYRF